MAAYGTSKLSAVNTMLTACAQAPVNSITNQTPDVLMAVSILDEVDRAMQTRGWYWNTELSHEITVAGTKYAVPESWIRIIDPGRYSGKQLVIRGDIASNGQRYIYDTRKRTFALGITGFKIDAVVYLDFELEMPEVARRFCTIRAARVFQARVLGSTERDGFAQRDEFAAERDLEQDDVEHARPNMFQDAVAQRIMRRGRTPLGGGSDARGGDVSDFVSDF